MKKWICILTAAILTLTLLGGCGKSENKTSEDNASDSQHSFVLFTMEDGGTFKIELYPEYAPKTVANFRKLVSEGFYDGLTFHRVVNDFMAQGGDPAQSGRSDTAETIPGEFSSNGFTQNTLHHDRGVVSMARTNDPNSASSQFFICYSDKYSASSLDGNYAAFGKVVEGMETIDGFLNVQRVYNSLGELATPVTPIVIAHAEIVDGGKTETKTSTEKASTDKTSTDADEASDAQHSFVQFTMKDGGTFKIELYPEYAPKTVANFRKLVSEGFYDGLTFHRVIDDFMAQGGDPAQSGRADSAETIPGEFSSNGFTQNTLHHDRGVISMARTTDPNSASSQFFICYSNSRSVSALDGNYAAFGKVVEGMETIDSFLDVERTYNGFDTTPATPVTPIVIAHAEIVDA